MQTKYWIAMFIGAMMSISFFAGCEDSGGGGGNDIEFVKCPKCGLIFEVALNPAPEVVTPSTSSSSGSSSGGSSNSGGNNDDDDNDSPTPTPTPTPTPVPSSSSSSGELPF